MIAAHSAAGHRRDRVRDTGCESVEEPHDQHAIHRRAHGPRREVDITVGPLANAVAKNSSEPLRQRFTFLIQEEKHQDRESDDERVSGHELCQRLRPAKERSRVGPLHPGEESSGVPELALPTCDQPRSDQWHVLQPAGNRDSLLVGGCDFHEQRLRFRQQCAEGEYQRYKNEHTHRARED